MMKQRNQVNLTEEERVRLEGMLESKDTLTTVKKRIAVLLKVNVGPGGEAMTREGCCAALGVAPSTVTNVCAQYQKEGLESLMSIKRNPNSDIANRKADDEAVDKMVALATNGQKWTYKTLAEAVERELGIKMTLNTVRRIVQKRGVYL